MLEWSVLCIAQVYQGHTLEKTYLGEDFFWAITPTAGDYVLFRFDRPVSIERYALCLSRIPLCVLWNQLYTYIFKVYIMCVHYLHVLSTTFPAISIVHAKPLLE